MASLLASINAAWKTSASTTAPKPTIPELTVVPTDDDQDLQSLQINVSDDSSPDDQEDEDPDTDDTPSFPAPNSIQRASTSSSTSKSKSTPAADTNALSLPPTTSTVAPKPRRKVGLEPGFSQLDWYRLTKSGQDLRGGATEFRRITVSELAQHRKREDVWSAFRGKVYNITPYLKYHPGGAGELMRAAGKDGTELFMNIHAWVNVDNDGRRISDVRLTMEVIGIWQLRRPGRIGAPRFFELTKGKIALRLTSHPVPELDHGNPLIPGRATVLLEAFDTVALQTILSGAK